MDVPLPENASWTTKLLVWALGLVLTALLALCAYLLKKFVGKQDTLETNIDGRFVKYTEDMSDIAKELTAATKLINFEAAEIRKANLAFQQKIYDELLAIKKELTEVEGTLDRTHSKASDLEQKFDGAMKRLEDVNARVDMHSKTLGMTSKIMAAQKQSIEKLYEEIRSTKEQIGNMTWIREVKKAKDKP